MSGGHAIDRQRLVRNVAVALVALILVGAVVISLTRGGDDGAGTGSDSAGSGGAARIDVPALPEGAPEVGSYVESTVGADGQVSVEAWIRSATPVSRIDAVTPDPDSLPGTVEARGVVVVASDGSRLASRRAVGTKSQRLRLREPVTEMYLRYTIAGDTVSGEQSTVEGRSLVRVTAMDVAFDGEAGPTVRVVRGPGSVMNLACLSAQAGYEQAPRGCGEPGDDGSWQVQLRGLNRHDRVLAQLEQ